MIELEQRRGVALRKFRPMTFVVRGEGRSGGRAMRKESTVRPSLLKKLRPTPASVAALAALVVALGGVVAVAEPVVAWAAAGGLKISPAKVKPGHRVKISGSASSCQSGYAIVYSNAFDFNKTNYLYADIPGKSFNLHGHVTFSVEVATSPQQHRGKYHVTAACFSPPSGASYGSVGPTFAGGTLKLK